MDLDIKRLIQQAATAAAERAVSLYAARHPRPAQVSVSQAAEMMGLDRHTITKLCRQGVLQRNATGNIPVEQVDAALRPAAARA